MTALIDPIAISGAMMTAHEIVESGYALWNSGTTYGVIGAQVGRAAGAGLINLYENLQVGNLNHAPEASPLWWRLIGSTYAAYAGGTTYALDDRVLDAAGHRVYQSAQAANTGHALTDAAWWTDAGPSNLWAPFDDRVGSAASWLGEFTYELAPGSIDALSVLDTNAETVTVVMEASAIEVYNETKSLNIGGAAINDWYRYFIDPVGARSSILFDDLPVYPAGIITVTVTGRDPASMVRAGTIAMGRLKDLGSTEVGAEVSIMDFSRKETNDFGQTMVVERGFSKRMTLRSMIQTDQVDSVLAILADLRAKPAVYIGSPGFDAMLIFGFYKDFSINLANASGSVSYVSLTVEGLSNSN